MATTGQAFFRYFQIVEESTYDTTPATPSTVQLRCSDIRPREEQRLIQNAAYKGDRKPGPPFRDVLNGSVQVTMPVYIDEIGWILKHGLGAAATTGSDPYTHTFKAGFSGASEGDIPTSLGVEIGYTDLDTAQYQRFTGMRVSEVVIPFGPGGPAQMQVTLVGNPPTAAYATSAWDSSPTSYTSDALSMTDISAMTEGGSASTIVLGGEIRLSNGLDSSMHTVNNSGKLGALPSGLVSVSGTVRVMYQSATELNKAINNTESSLGVTWTSGSTSLALTIPELKYDRTCPEPGSGSGLVVSLPFMAFEGNHADATLLKAVLINSVSSY